MNWSKLIADCDGQLASAGVPIILWNNRILTDSNWIVRVSYTGHLALIE